MSVLLKYRGDEYSLEFDGLHDYVDIQNTSFASDPSGTVILWAYFTDDGVSYLFGVGRDGGNGLAFNVNPSTDGVGIQHLYYGSSPGQGFIGQIIDTNQWYHFAFVSHGSGSPYEVYLNGIKLDDFIFD